MEKIANDPPFVSSLGSYLCNSGPRLGWSGFHPSNWRGYSRMDRNLDIAVWENFSHKPDLIHLSCWQPEATKLPAGSSPLLRVSADEKHPNALQSGRRRHLVQDSTRGLGIAWTPVQDYRCTREAKNTTVRTRVER
jgi:hypothetical protein